MLRAPTLAWTIDSLVLSRTPIRAGSSPICRSIPPRAPSTARGPLIARTIQLLLVGAIFMLVGGCHGVRDYSIEVLAAQSTTGQPRGQVTAAITSVATVFHLEPVVFPHGSYDSPPAGGVEILCSFRLPDEEGVEVFDLLLWVEVRAASLLARARQYRPGWLESREARVIWDYVATILHAHFPGQVRERRIHEPTSNR